MVNFLTKMAKNRGKTVENLQNLEKLREMGENPDRWPLSSKIADILDSPTLRELAGGTDGESGGNEVENLLFTLLMKACITTAQTCADRGVGLVMLELLMVHGKIDEMVEEAG